MSEERNNENLGEHGSQQYLLWNPGTVHGFGFDLEQTNQSSTLKKVLLIEYKNIIKNVYTTI